MAKHIKELSIQSFRGVKNLSLNELNHINILTGDNNCGKTSILEVLESLEGPDSIAAWTRLSRSSESIYEHFNELFNFDTQEPIKYYINDINDNITKVNVSFIKEELTLTKKEIFSIDRLSRNFNAHIGVEDGEEEIEDVNAITIIFQINDKKTIKEKIYDFQRRSKISRGRTSIIKTTYISPFQHAEGRIFLKNVLNSPELYEEMLEVLKEFDDGIISINAESKEDKSLRRISYKILSKNHKNAIPLNLYGDGMKKAILLMSAVITSKDGILLLDEFETAIHTSAMDKVFSWILNTCIKLNIQLFITSHSEEAIDKVLKCSPKLQDKINLYTLYNNSDEIVSRNLSAKKAIEAKEDLGLELR